MSFIMLKINKLNLIFLTKQYLAHNLIYVKLKLYPAEL